MADNERQQITKARQRRPGKVRISPTVHGPEGREFRIELEDDVSGAIVVVIEGRLDDLGVALGGAHVPCDFRVTNQDLVGMKREHKRMTIFVPRLKTHKEYGWNVDPADPMVRRTLAPFEVSGWSASLADLTNHHNHRRDVTGNALIQLALAADLENLEGGAQEVSFVRYIDPDTGEPVKLDGGR